MCFVFTFDWIRLLWHKTNCISKIQSHLLQKRSALHHTSPPSSSSSRKGNGVKLANAKFHTMCVHTNTHTQSHAHIKSKTVLKRRQQKSKIEIGRKHYSVPLLRCWFWSIGMWVYACEKLTVSLKPFSYSREMRFCKCAHTFFSDMDLCVHKTSLWLAWSSWFMVDFCVWPKEMPRENPIKFSLLTHIHIWRWKTLKKSDFKEPIR